MPGRLFCQRGFSAIEVLVGMTLLVIVAAALGSQMTVSTITAQQSKERARALSLARAQADRLRSLDYRDLAMPSGTQDTTQQQSDWASLYCPVPASTDPARCGKDSAVMVRARKSTDWDVPYITDVATGLAHACGVATNGSVLCWGNNSAGQLGNGSSSSSSTPVTVSGITTAVQVAAGNQVSCALLADQTVKCWGLNSTYGLLGDGSGSSSSTTPVAVSGLSGVVAISAMSEHLCAVLQGGTIKCWGRNDYGQLGDASTTKRTSPVAVSGITNATAVSVGGLATCARLSTGAARCWGYGGYGQLGTGSTSSSSTPLDPGLVDVLQVAVGTNHSCALLGAGTLRCWGLNSAGQFGDGTTTRNYSPTAAGQGLSGLSAVSVGSASTCALAGSGTLSCWGDNSAGKLGIGSTDNQLTPVAINLSGAVSDAAGSYYDFFCFARVSAKPLCAGTNTSGQLGDGTTTSSTTPVTVKVSFAGENSVDSWRSASEDPAVIGTRVDPRIGKQVEREAGQLPQSAVSTHTVNGITLYTYIYWGGESMSSGVPVFTPGNRQWKVIEVVARYRDLPDSSQFSGQADRARYSSVTVVQPVYDGPGASQIPSS